MPERRIIIRLSGQTLELLENGASLASFPISTAAKGSGELSGSGQTPRGIHCIREMIGGDLRAGAVLNRRQPTGEVFSTDLAVTQPDRDWILSRILWLDGLEEGKNKGGDVDTYGRYIYIHGTPDSEPMGVPRSHGCIRMRNDDVIALFKQVAVGTIVDIVD